ncbi:thioredoxin [Chitinivibrio alkaliphilus]|uniref:Thioredoxin domain-containing protein n=1 Tax=Chitinivibrio alkaliphilus ACht1 TaxID=1313304 RepID=U7D5X7_9BACT|nr:thioredoxin [Chitinivibrio alkaliphilus]ERP31914.1 thioredoxin domain-containing protein [Chitinivibrio alkaliphilus ACht1]
MKHIVSLLFLLLLSTITLGEPHEPKGALLFFINPTGRPCIIQDKEIQENLTLPEQFDLSYISTDVPADRSSFMQYGVRALPQLILVDSEGDILHRFPPGIQSAAQIETALANSAKGDSQ